MTPFVPRPRSPPSTHRGSPPAAPPRLTSAATEEVHASNVTGGVVGRVPGAFVSRPSPGPTTTSNRPSLPRQKRAQVSLPGPHPSARPHPPLSNVMLTRHTIDPDPQPTVIPRARLRSLADSDALPGAHYSDLFHRGHDQWEEPPGLRRAVIQDQPFVELDTHRQRAVLSEDSRPFSRPHRQHHDPCNCGSIRPA